MNLPKETFWKLNDNLCRSCCEKAVEIFNESQPVAAEFFVVMQKRRDGKVYADLHKCLPTMFLTLEDAQAALEADPELKPHRHIVRMLAEVPDEEIKAIVAQGAK